MSKRTMAWAAALGLTTICAAMRVDARPLPTPQDAPPPRERRVPRPATSLSAPDRAAALREITAAFEKMYVFPAMRPKIVARLEESARAGRYELDDPAAFAERITDDLRDVADDKHLSLIFDPAAFAAAQAPPASDAGEEARGRRRAIRRHHGLVETRVLAGNVRYLKIAGFEWVPDETGAAYDAAMRVLKGGDALIIDLRGNGGGSHAAVQYLVSHFLEPNTLEMTFLAGSDTPMQARSLEHLPAGRLTGKPLYVLIDGGVASAGEACAYDVQQFALGELVGAKTVGAANNNRHVPIAPGFILSVSYGRPVHAVSQGNWEGVGVAPTVEALPAQALEVAHWLALERLMARPDVSPEARAEYAWAKIGVEARLHPVTMTDDRLRALADRYGDVDVQLRDGSLWLARSHRPTVRLVPLTANGLFAVEGVDDMRVRFTSAALELLFLDAPGPRLFPRGHAIDR
ncbi:MAG: S41 family peptidase [Vicinamibacteraceae bacterium]